MKANHQSQYCGLVVQNCSFLLVVTYFYNCTDSLFMCLHPPEDRLGFDKLGRDITEDIYRNNFEHSCDYHCNDEPIDKKNLDLSIIQLNVRGVVSKIDKLETLLHKIKKSSTPDIVILCETWLTPSSLYLRYQVTSM